MAESLLDDEIECEVLYFSDDREEINKALDYDVRFELAPSFVNDVRKIPKRYELMGRLHYRTKTSGEVTLCRKALFVARNVTPRERLPSLLIGEHLAGRTGYDDDVLTYATLMEYAIRTCWTEPCDELACALVCKSPSLLIALLFDLINDGVCAAGPFVPRLCWLWACIEAAGSPNHDCFDGCSLALAALRSRTEEPTKRRKKDQEVEGHRSSYRMDRYELTESDVEFLIDATKQMCASPFAEAPLEVVKAARAKRPPEERVLRWNKSEAGAPMTRFGRALLLPLLYARDPPPVMSFYALPKDAREERKLCASIHLAWLWESRVGSLQTKNNNARGWAEAQKRYYPACKSEYAILYTHPNLYYVLAAHVLASSKLFEDPTYGSAPEGTVRSLAAELESKRGDDAARTLSYADQIHEEARLSLRQDEHVKAYLDREGAMDKSVDDVLRREVRGLLCARYKKCVVSKEEHLLDLEYFRACCADLAREAGPPAPDDELGRKVTRATSGALIRLGSKIASDLRRRPRATAAAKKRPRAPAEAPRAKEKVQSILDLFRGFAESERKKRELERRSKDA